MPEFYFCSEVGCRLHVRPGDPGVHGDGNWAVLPEGTIIGRCIQNGRYVCDDCARALRAVTADQDSKK